MVSRWLIRRSVRSVMAILGCCVLLNVASCVEAQTTRATAGATGLLIDLTITNPILPTITIDTGRLAASDATGVSDSQSNSLFTFMFAPFISVSLLGTDATTNWVFGGAGTAAANAALESLSIGIPFVISLTTQGIKAHAEASDVPPGPPTASGTTGFLGANLSIFGNIIDLGTVGTVAPPDTVLFSGGGVTVTENAQTITLTPTFARIDVDALFIDFTNVTVPGIGSVINGFIEVNDAVAQISTGRIGIPHPSSVLLLVVGAIALGTWRCRGTQPRDACGDQCAFETGAGHPEST